MRIGRWALPGLAIALCATLPAQAKPEKASKALRAAAKELTKRKSYRVDFTVRGGTARGEDHAFTETRVNQSWSASTRGKVVRLNGGDAFRLRRRDLDGAIQTAQGWKALLATDQGRLIGRLFQSPEVALAEAYKQRRNARWVESETPVGGSAERPSLPAGDDQTAGGTRARRVERSSEAGEAKGEERLPRVIRVEGQPKEAVTHFNRIVTSGCFTEG